jgi:hypothetical protein
MQTYSDNTIQPVRYMGEILLRTDAKPTDLGTQVDRLGVAHQITRIEPNGLCFGVPLDWLERLRLYDR